MLRQDDIGSLKDPAIRAALITAAAALVLAFGLRYLLIEPRAMGEACSAAAPPAWCAARQAVVLVFRSGFLGIAALVGAALSFWRGGRVMATAALGLGLLGLVLYDADVAAVGTVAALLRLARA